MTAEGTSSVRPLFGAELRRLDRDGNRTCGLGPVRCERFAARRRPLDMEPILERGNEDSPRVERSRPDPDASTVVLVFLAVVLVGIVFLLLTSGSAAA